MVWPALLLEQRLVAVVPIGAGLITEWLALRFGGFGLSWRRGALVDVVMNVVSTIGGMFVIPLLGLAWEFFPGMLIYKIFKVGTFNDGTWLATFLLATIATSGIEALVVRWGFRIAMNKWRLAVLFLANTVSVGIAFASLWLRPPHL